MRTVRQPRAVETREKILGEAARLFALKGYHDTKLEEILKAAQVTTGAFFHHFGSKEELGFAVIDHHMEKRRELLEEIEKRLPPPDEDDPLQPVFRRLDAIQEMIRRREQRKGGCIIGNLSTALSDTHDAFRRRLAECFDEMDREFRPHLAAAAAKYCPGRSVDAAAVALYRGHRRGLDHAHAHPARPAHDGTPLRLPERAPETVALRSRLIGGGRMASARRCGTAAGDATGLPDWAAEPTTRVRYSLIWVDCTRDASNGKEEPDDQSHSLPPGLMALAVAALWGPSFQRAAAQVPEENRKQLVEALGPPFIVFRDKVMDELKVSDDQREKLMQLAMEQVMETGPFLESLAESGPEREKKLEEHRKKVREKLAGHLKDVLQPAQRDRLGQVTLQQEGPFALGRDDVRKELKITQEQMMKFMAIVQDLHKKVEPLIKDAQSGGNPEEIRPKIEQLRKDHARELEGVLTDAQRKQWKEMLGPPFELGD